MLRKILIGIIVSLLFSYCSYASTDTVFVGKGSKFDTAAAGYWYPIKISGLKPGKLNDSFGLEYINVNLKCSDVSLLNIYLMDPRGGWYCLNYLYTASGKNFDSTFFTDTASLSLHFGKAPYKGTYISQDFLRQINNGQTIDSTWYLYIRSYNNVKTDYLKNWSMCFGTKPMTDFKLDSSNLPILVVNTQGNAVPWDYYNNYYGRSIIYPIYDPSSKYNHMKDSMLYKSCGTIELHGNYSRAFPKLSYNIRTTDVNYVDSNRTFLGFPKEHEWCLIANYPDRSLLRNAMAQHLYASLGNYSPRVKHVELVLNGKYMGVFSCIEKIKVGKNRVNIAKMDTINYNSGDSLTGGYMIKEDWKGSIGWNSRYYMPTYGTSWYPYFRFYNPDIPSVKQKQYIQSFYDSFENAMNGNIDSSKITGSPGNWRNFIDEKNMTDFFFVQEITKNLDGYRASFYMWKDRNSIDRHIHLGPVWDFDWSQGTSGWNGEELNTFEYNNGWGSAFWWYKLLGTGGYGKGDSKWKDHTKCRWTMARRTNFNFKSLDNWVDSNATLLSDAQTRNFKEWPEFGNVTGILNVSMPGLAKNYAGEISNYKSWLHKRISWLDKNIPGTCREDIDAPTVSLIWKDTVYLEVNTHYKDSGIIYHDNYGDTNVSIIKGSSLDTAALGTYTISWFLSDKAGNKASIIRVVIVIDTIAPEIAFPTGDTITTEVLVQCIDTNALVHDNYDVNPLISKWGTFKFPNNIPDSLGYFTLWFKAIDQSGNMDSAFKVIHVVDTRAPIISNKGKDTVLIEVYNTYSDSDISISDNFDKNPVLIHHGSLKNFKTDSLGIFTIWYVANDFSGNKDSISRTIVVIDTLAPHISLTGRDSVFLMTNDSIAYKDSGYIAIDNYDKHLKIDTTGNFVNTKNAGTFFISYQATDQSLNKSSKVSRIITVTEVKDTSAGIETFYSGNKNISIYPNPGGGQFSITVKLSDNSKAYLSVYDETGRELPGQHFEVSNGWTGLLHLENEPAGIYTLKLQTGIGTATRRLILIK